MINEKEDNNILNVFNDIVGDYMHKHFGSSYEEAKAKPEETKQEVQEKQAEEKVGEVVNAANHLIEEFKSSYFDSEECYRQFQEFVLFHNFKGIVDHLYQQKTHSGSGNMNTLPIVAEAQNPQLQNLIQAWYNAGYTTATYKVSSGHN